MRILNFPSDQSYGKLHVLEKEFHATGVSKQNSDEAYDARGKVRIPRNKQLCLSGSYALNEHMDVLKNLPADSLVKLDLGKLSIGSAALANITHLTGLQSLDLDGCDVDDQSLQYIKRLDNLQYLSISRTLLKGRTIGELASLKKLKRLHCSHCDMDQAGMSQVSKLKTLLWLHIASDKVSDNTLAAIAEIDGLLDLALDGNNKITDYGIKKLAKLKKLQRLSLDDTKVTETGLLTLQGMPLKWLRLCNTRVLAGSMARLNRVFPGCSIDLTKKDHVPTDIFAPLH